jgi:predicted transcriptional regulator
MAMTLRLSDEETEALRAYAQNAHLSMQDVAREAIRVYVSDRTARRNDILARIVSEDAELLDLLSK